MGNKGKGRVGLAGESPGLWDGARRLRVKPGPREQGGGPEGGREVCEVRAHRRLPAIARLPVSMHPWTWSPQHASGICDQSVMSLTPSGDPQPICCRPPKPRRRGGWGGLGRQEEASSCTSPSCGAGFFMLESTFRSPGSHRMAT
ncbi:hypothetical protein EYF80_016484 [Liparis tanakae]|uniref:Uncharacterized protein n=1 Tax=Liparis tanakae TaxID=230148 RepID=A0A4Z2I6F2_9TELE|nr:hypothetical protein EYF80_016484 [Liparis tanakae]